MKKKLFGLAALVAAFGSTATTASAQDVLTGEARDYDRALAEYNECIRREDEERRRQSWMN